MKIFDNPVIVNMAFGKISKAMQESKTTMITVELDSEGKITEETIKYYTGDVVVVPKQDLENLQKLAIQ